jgi:branched-chain amino acid aminotransferase
MEMKLSINLVDPEKRKLKPQDIMNVAFGTIFTDHFFLMQYHNDTWQNAKIEPYHTLELDPAALCLHYGQAIFEGMKAYRRGDRVLLFRASKNFERMNASAERMVMPRIDSSFVLDSLKKLISIEKDWIPELTGTSLYIRPTLIASEPKLGVRPSNQYLFYILLSPVGPYFKEGFKPVKIMVSEKYVRAVKGGVGAAKTAGNYAAGLFAGTKAKELGCSQVLWLDALENEYLEEVGTMNIFVQFDDELATPTLSGTILPGITRDSVIRITKNWGHNVNERKISITEVIEGLKSGKVLEVFGCGTAAIIAPVGLLHYKGTSHDVAEGKIGVLTQKLFDELTGIQCGERPDKYNWVVEI